MRQISFILLILILSACRSIVPATSPPQLDYTPDFGIVVSDETVVTDSFQVDYPDGWRVVKISIAGEPLELVFASLDDSMWIKVAEVPISILEETPDPNIYKRLETLEIGGIKIYTQGQSSIEARTIFDESYQHVLDSIRIR